MRLNGRSDACTAAAAARRAGKRCTVANYSILASTYTTHSIYYATMPVESLDSVCHCRVVLIIPRISASATALRILYQIPLILCSFCWALHTRARRAFDRRERRHRTASCRFSGHRILTATRYCHDSDCVVSCLCQPSAVPVCAFFDIVREIFTDQCSCFVLKPSIETIDLPDRRDYLFSELVLLYECVIGKRN